MGVRFHGIELQSYWESRQTIAGVHYNWSLPEALRVTEPARTSAISEGPTLATIPLAPHHPVWPVKPRFRFSI